MSNVRGVVDDEAEVHDENHNRHPEQETTKESVSKTCEVPDANGKRV